MSQLNTSVLKKISNLIFTATMIVVVLLVIATYFSLQSERKVVLQEASKNMESMALILSKEADSVFTLGNAVLESIITELSLGKPHSFDNLINVHQTLKNKRNLLVLSSELPSFGHIFIIHHEGYNIANSVSHPVKRVNVQERKYFNYHKNHMSLKLRISQPSISKITKERVIYLTKRLNDSDGNFAGLVGVHLRLNHFDNLYRQLNLPPGGTVTLIREDGWGIFRFPLIDTFFDKSIAGRPLYQQMLLQKQGHLISPKSPYDGYSRIAGYKYNNRFALVNIISVTVDSILYEWHKNVIQVSVIAAIGSFFVILLGLFTSKQIRNLVRAISESLHDPLTGMWNRRYFDERLHEEWKRAIRSNFSISIIYLDIDYFKQYNDHYGHNLGDQCLKSVATCIKENILRSGEITARIGGEEFAIVLPSSDEKSALAVAEKVRSKIEKLAIPHHKSLVSQVVTISLGVATTIPQKGDLSEQLVENADKALYQSKENGRNQVTIYKP
ncbi:MAG: GGDEF domain-containing protein [Gammaproteobacteria bacterium]|nr:GGDEF domain-containing protein [Gammaproteobacteria bacterium]